MCQFWAPHFRKDMKITRGEAKKKTKNIYTHRNYNFMWQDCRNQGILIQRSKDQRNVNSFHSYSVKGYHQE